MNKIRSGIDELIKLLAKIIFGNMVYEGELITQVLRSPLNKLKRDDSKELKIIMPANTRVNTSYKKRVNADLISGKASLLINLKPETKK